VNIRRDVPDNGREHVPQGRHSLDDLVGTGEKRRMYRDPLRFRGLEIDDQFVLRRRLHWQAGGIFTPEDTIDVAGRPTILFEQIRTIVDKASARGVNALPVNRGKLLPRRQSDDQFAMSSGNRARSDDQAAIWFAGERSDCTLNFAGITCVDGGQLDPTEGATYWITANAPIPGGVAASRITAAGIMLGAICFSNSGHFAARL
jgi:hypothetical protein